MEFIVYFNNRLQSYTHTYNVRTIYYEKPLAVIERVELWFAHNARVCYNVAATTTTTMIVQISNIMHLLYTHDSASLLLNYNCIDGCALRHQKGAVFLTLRVYVSFMRTHCGLVFVDWTAHVFTKRYIWLVVWVAYYYYY